MIEGFDLKYFNSSTRTRDCISTCKNYSELPTMQVLYLDMFYDLVDNTDCHYRSSKFDFNGFE